MKDQFFLLFSLKVKFLVRFTLFDRLLKIRKNDLVGDLCKCQFEKTFNSRRIIDQSELNVRFPLNLNSLIQSLESPDVNVLKSPKNQLAFEKTNYCIISNKKETSKI